MTNIHSQFEQFKAWSMLTDTPVLFLDRGTQEYYVFWHGVKMHSKVALLLASVLIAKLPFSKSILHSLKDYGINHRDDLTLLSNQVLPAVQQLDSRNTTAGDILSWFDPRNASVVPTNA